MYFYIDSIRYLSLHDNQFIRYFKGHRDRVVSLCVSPIDDSFISASLDNTVMFWDLRSASPQGKIDVKGRPVVAYDPKGVCFAVGCAINLIKMYDKRKFDAGPFTQFPLKSQKTIEFMNMKFSPRGKYLSVMTSDSLMLVDAFSGDQLAEFTDFENGSSMNLEASFTPDEQYLISGSENGSVHMWHTQDRYSKVAEFQGHAGPVHCVQFNPYYSMFTSGCTNLAFWIPVSSTSNTTTNASRQWM
jgi:COMPASS component SWD2